MTKQCSAILESEVIDYLRVVVPLQCSLSQAGWHGIPLHHLYTPYGRYVFSDIHLGEGNLNLILNHLVLISFF